MLNCEVLPYQTESTNGKHISIRLDLQSDGYYIIGKVDGQIRYKKFIGKIMPAECDLLNHRYDALNSLLS